MFEEIKKELDKEYNSLVDYHNECYDKVAILDKNTKKKKLEITGALTLLAIIPVFIAGISLLQGIPFSSISMTLTFASITAVSGVIGYLGQKLITIKSKRKMKKFTNANKNREIVKELTNYQLEKKKTQKKIEVIAAIYDKIVSKEKILEEITADGKYTVTENSLSEEELNKNYEIMLQNYNNKMQELDVIVSQEFLRTKFRDYRKKLDRVPTAIANGFTLSLLLSFPTCMGFMGDQLKNQETIESMYEILKSIVSCFIPALAVSPITILSMVRRSNDNLYAFNELNNTLGENALQQKPDKKREENLEQNIEKLTNELVELGYSLRKTEYALREISLKTSDEEKSQSLRNNNEKTWDEVQISEEDVKVYMQESPAPFNPDTIFGVDESLEKKSGKRLIRKLTPPNND